ncbi:hypothetical protein LguiB_021948 [Lonicera macranthoides]
MIHQRRGENEWRYASVKFGKVTLEMPRFLTGDKLSADSGKEYLELLPRHARLQNMTYSSKMKVKIHVQGDCLSRVDNLIGGCTTLIISLQQKLEALQSWVITLEARLGGGYSNANPSLFLAPLGSSSRFLSSADNIAPEVVPTTVNLPQPRVPPINGDLSGYPCSEGLFWLLMSIENVASNILPTTMNLSEHRAFPIYLNISDYQARLEGFSGGSSQVGSVAEVAGSSNPNWIVLGYNSFDYSSSDLSVILNFGTDDRQNF